MSLFFCLYGYCLSVPMFKLNDGYDMHALAHYGPVHMLGHNELFGDWASFQFLLAVFSLLIR